MTQWVQHHDRRSFAARVLPLLIHREAANNLQLGIVSRFAQGKSGSLRSDDATDPLMLTLESDVHRDDSQSDVLAVAIRTPPFPIVLTDVPTDAIGPLVDWLLAAAERDATSPAAKMAGVVGPVETSRQFAIAWAERTGCATPLKHSIRAYELTRVVWPRTTEGDMSPATPADWELLVEWAEAFGREIHEPLDDRQKLIDEHIANGRMFVWRVGVGAASRPVAMACLGGATPNGMRVNLVYTPRDLRGRGYASNLVAKMSQHALDIGNRFCFLFADNSNPTSTGIYLRMGYQPICDYEKHDFVDAR